MKLKLKEEGDIRDDANGWQYTDSSFLMDGVAGVLNDGPWVILLDRFLGARASPVVLLSCGSA